jgi:DNA repair exonuclease SbcCD ATPase subunit
LIQNIKLSEQYDIDNKKIINHTNIIEQYNDYKNYTNKKKADELLIIINKIQNKLATIQKYNNLMQLKSDFDILTKNNKIENLINTVSNNLQISMDKLIVLNDNNRELLTQKTILIEKKKRVDELKLEEKDYSDELEFLNMYQKCVDKKKGISNKILIDLCVLLNRECNRILHQIADFELEISIDNKQIMRIYTIDNNIKIPASMSSGYQKFILDIIIRVVLTSVLGGNTSNNISNPNMLIIDEGFGCLDKQNFIEVAEVLPKIKKTPGEWLSPPVENLTLNITYR